MHARVTTVTFQRDKVDEAIKLLNSRGVELRGMKGFHNILFIADRATGKGTIMTLWNSEDDLKAIETNGYYQARLAELAPLCAGQPTREVFTVVVDDLTGLSSAHAERVTSYLVQQNKIDEVTRIARDTILPAARQQQGFSGLLGLLDRSTSKCIGCTFWASEADLKASEANGYYQAQIAKLQPLLAGQPTREVLELTLPALVPAPVGQTQLHAPAP